MIMTLQNCMTFFGTQKKIINISTDFVHIMKVILVPTKPTLGLIEFHYMDICVYICVCVCVFNKKE